MKTFILFWNPSISSDKGNGRAKFITALQDGCYYSADWAVWDWKEAHKGDRFYKVKVGDPDPAKNGIVESGFFKSDPYQGEDWSGRGREVYYCDLTFDAMIDYDFVSPLTIEKLTKEISNFDWTGGHSGRLLDAESANELDTIWCEHLIDIQEDDTIEDVEQHIYLCNRLDNRLITWYDTLDYDEEEEEYGPEEETDYTNYGETFRIKGIKGIDYDAVLGDAAKAISPDGEDYAIIGLVYDCDDKKILEKSRLYIKGLSSQGVTLIKYKNGTAQLELDWMTSAGDNNLAVQILYAMKKQAPKCKLMLMLDDEQEWEIPIDDDMLLELNTVRLRIMMDMLSSHANQIFGIEGIRHMFYISPAELRETFADKNMAERAKLMIDEFCTVQWAYEDYDAIGPCEVKDPAGEEYTARIITNSSNVFVGNAERICLMNGMKQVKIVLTFDFIDAASKTEYFHKVDPIQFTLEKMPENEWEKLFNQLDGELMNGE